VLNASRRPATKRFLKGFWFSLANLAPLRQVALSSKSNALQDLDDGPAEAYKKSGMTVLAASSVRPHLLLGAILILAASAAGAPPRNLLSTLDVSLIKCNHARAYQDPRTKALTITFDYFAGESEARLPVRSLGWPADWSEYRSLQYTFHTTSQESLSIAFSNGATSRSFLTEPLPGIRVFGVVPFDAFIQSRTMTPLNPWDTRCGWSACSPSSA
jgi:hypothetical protein